MSNSLEMMKFKDVFFFFSGAPVASSSSSATNIAGTNGSSPVSGEGALVIDTSPVAGTSTGGPTVSTPGISSSNNGGVFAHNRLINQPLSCSSKRECIFFHLQKWLN